MRLENRSIIKEKARRERSKPKGKRPGHQETSSDSEREEGLQDAYEDLSSPYKRPKPTPFTQRITRFKYHKRAKLPRNIKTLGEAARNWFDDLDPKCVDCFEELSQKFLEEFSQQNRYAKDPTEIHGIKRKQNEGLQAFMDQFKSESSHIKGVHPVLRISAFMHGHGDKGYIHPAWTGGPEKARNRGGPREARRNMGIYTLYPRKDTFTPLVKTPKVVLAMESVSFPKLPPLIRTPKKQNLNKLCDYHGDRGHNTNDCYQLKKKIEEVVASGKLAHLMKDILQNNQWSGNQGRNGVKIINMIREGENCKRPFEEGRSGLTDEITFLAIPHNELTDEPIILEGIIESQNSEDAELQWEALWECRQLERMQGSWKEVQWRQHEEQMSIIKEQDHVDSRVQTVIDKSSAGKHRVVHKIRPMTPDRRLVLKEKVFRWLKEGMIRKVRHPIWVASTIPVKLANRAWKVQVDYSSLNKACAKDMYPFPEEGGGLASIMGYPYKCFLRLSKEYSKIRMTEDDKEKTEFHTEEGVYCFTHMTKELKNSVARLQRMMEKVLADQKGRNVEIYLEEIVIKSKSKLDLVQDVEEILRKLKRVNIKIDLVTSSFGVKKGRFLSYMTNESEEALQRIKRKLNKLQTLAVSKEGKILILCLHQKDETISSVLLVEREGIQIHVSYVNQPLQGMEICYTLTKKTVQALIHTTRSLREIFRKHKVKVITDGPMEEILKLSGKEGRLAKWAAEIRIYDISYTQRKEAEGSIVKKFCDQGEQLQEILDAYEGGMFNLNKKLQEK
nr:hypothetical protein [Tanacetum cinerariifolium]